MINVTEFPELYLHNKHFLEYKKYALSQISVDDTVSPFHLYGDKRLDSDDTRTYISESEAKGLSDRFVRHINYSSFLIMTYLMEFRSLFFKNENKNFPIKKVIKKHSTPEMLHTLFMKLQRLGVCIERKNNLLSKEFNFMFLSTNPVINRLGCEYSYTSTVNGLDVPLDYTTFGLSDFKKIANTSSNIYLCIGSILIGNSSVSIELTSTENVVTKHAVVRHFQRDNTHSSCITTHLLNVFCNLFKINKLPEGYQILIPSDNGIFLGGIEGIDKSGNYKNKLNSIKFYIDRESYLTSRTQMRINELTPDLAKYERRLQDAILYENTEIYSKKTIRTFIPYSYCSSLQVKIAYLLRKLILKESTSEEDIQFITRIQYLINNSEKFLFDKDYFGQDSIPNEEIEELDKISINELLEDHQLQEFFENSFI